MSGEKEEFGPWIEHDGKGCPCVGQFVRSVERGGRMDDHIAGGVGDGLSRQWDWGSGIPKSMQIIRYRIRKPKGLTILTDILREVERDGDKVYGDRELEECRV